MDTWEAITSRRNVRSFSDRPIDPDDLDRILEAGRRAPSSRNSQPWAFVVCTDREQLAELAKVWQGAGHVAQSAATIAVVVSEADEPLEREMIQFDVGQATIMMMLAATGMGIGSAHAWVIDQDLATRVLGLPEGKRLALLIALGHPTDRPLTPISRPSRRPFDDVVHRERW